MVAFRHYDTYLPGHFKDLLKETGWKGPKVSCDFLNGHAGGDDDKQEWKIRNIVLDNVAYPCVYEEGDEFHEVYSDAMDALYDDMKRKVNEFCRTGI